MSARLLNENPFRAAVKINNPGTSRVYVMMFESDGLSGEHGGISVHTHLSVHTTHPKDLLYISAIKSSPKINLYSMTL
jgi:hypothetical protein